MQINENEEPYGTRKVESVNFWLIKFLDLYWKVQRQYQLILPNYIVSSLSEWTSNFKDSGVFDKDSVQKTIKSFAFSCWKTYSGTGKVELVHFIFTRNVKSRSSVSC